MFLALKKIFPKICSPIYITYFTSQKLWSRAPFWNSVLFHAFLVIIIITMVAAYTRYTVLLVSASMCKIILQSLSNADLWHQLFLRFWFTCTPSVDDLGQPLASRKSYNIQTMRCYFICLFKILQFWSILIRCTRQEIMVKLLNCSKLMAIW